MRTLTPCLHVTRVSQVFHRQFLIFSNFFNFQGGQQCARRRRAQAKGSEGQGGGRGRGGKN